MRDYDVVLESFRPGVLDRLGVGYERMREQNPGIVFCAISGYGQDSPKRDASGHDMNYLGLIGLLGLTGARGGEPVQSAGQIADIGGGALMAAFGIMAALRERDGAPGRRAARARASWWTCRWPTARCRGWRWWPASYFADGAVPRRGELPLAGSLICYRPYECADGWVTLGALEPKFWQAFCRGVGREELIEQAVRAAGLGGAREVVADLPGAHARAVAGVRQRARLLPRAGAGARRGARLRARARARRWSSRSSSRAPSGAVRQLGLPVKLSRTPGEHARLPGPALGEHTEAGAAATPATPSRKSTSCS